MQRRVPGAFGPPCSLCLGSVSSVTCFVRFLGIFRSSLNNGERGTGTAGGAPARAEGVPGFPEHAPEEAEHVPEVPEQVPEEAEHAPKVPERVPEEAERVPEVPEHVPEGAEHAPEVPEPVPKGTMRAPERAEGLPETAGSLTAAAGAAARRGAGILPVCVASPHRLATHRRRCAPSTARMAVPLRKRALARKSPRPGASLASPTQRTVTSSQGATDSPVHKNFCGLRAAGCGLRAAGCGLRAAGCGLRAVGCGLRAAGCGLRAVDCGLRAAGCGLRAAGVRAAGCGLRAAGCGLRAAGCDYDLIVTRIFVKHFRNTFRRILHRNPHASRAHNPAGGSGERRSVAVVGRQAVVHGKARTLPEFPAGGEVGETLYISRTNAFRFFR
ncbi:hypothetical protein OpiT1DRAFT_04286 [Opitutaceae bacterium TAV1]|nr:hypothetical protein OpiT1DRAFT_04286 [Opitutaceae bacterium TAV1]